MRKPELLAPAGSMEALKAAVAAGCDAVYLGGYIFGARSFASNFSDDEMIEAIEYCHLRKVKVYVTVNTLVHEDKVEAFFHYIDFLYENNVDAIILQDIGMLDYIRKVYPNLEIHASTQMHIHNLEGIQLLEEIGVSRVVLAREVTIEQIKNIKENTKMEIEIFGHGALCVSYSGQCLMSSMIGGRSGNLGTCSQSCRMKYDFISNGKKLNSESYLLSMKDLNTLNYIGEFINASVDSIKIEGRMKSVEYVYMVTKLYRQAIDNYMKYGETRITNADLEKLSLLFNRKFTKGFLFNEANQEITHSYRPNHMGIPIGKVIESSNDYLTIQLEKEVTVGDGIRILGKNEDEGGHIQQILVNNKIVTNALVGDKIKIPFSKKLEQDSKVIKTSSVNLMKEIQNKLKENIKFPIRGYIRIEIDKPISLTLIDENRTVKVTSDTKVAEALNTPTSKERIIEQLSKLGNSIYEMEQIEVEIVGDTSIFIPIVVLNELRRQAVLKLNQKRLYKRPNKKSNYEISLPDFSISQTHSILIYQMKDYLEVKDKYFESIYVEDIGLYNELKSDTRVILKLPRVINHFYEYDNPLVIGELGSIYKYRQLNLISDFSFNVANSYAIAFLHSLGINLVTLSYELKKEEIAIILKNYQERYKKQARVEVIVSSIPEVMISKFNLPKLYHSTEQTNYLKDRFGNLFKIISEDDYMRIFHYERLEEKDYHSYFNMGVSSLRIHKDL